MTADDDDWPIRTVARADIVEHLLIWHFGHAFEGVDGIAARREIGQAIDRWLDLGLKCARSQIGEQLFDPVEVQNFLMDAGLRGDDEFWERHCVRMQRGLLLSWHGAATDPDRIAAPADLPPRRFRVDLEREYGAASGSRLRLRLPLPIADHALRDLAIEYRVPPQATAAIKPAMLDASLVLDPPAPVTLGFTADFSAHVDTGAAGSLSDEDRALFTAPQEQLIGVTPTIAAMAQNAAQGHGDDWTKVTALFDYLNDNFRLGGVPYHALDLHDPAAWSIRTGIADCQIASALFCGMCRSLAIPARIVSGFQLYAFNHAYHYWAEVWIEGRGWLSFDFNSWMLSCGGRDLAWRRVHMGVMDYRLKVQVLPRLFTGPSTIRLPRAWHMLMQRLPEGFENRFIDAYTGAHVYSDRLFLRPTGSGQIAA